ncbi:MAG: adenylate/guanylate cyclase domain-containing protein [Ilumatobacteraceae bacterium]
MARLNPSERAELPDRAFAYVDRRGQRRLPIHDAAHVRNALARFGRVAFDDESARTTARTRLLRAAQRFRIVPVGFINSELGQRSSGRRRLPKGFVTMVMTDIEGSTGLVHRLGDRYRAVLDAVCTVQREATKDAGGDEVEARADEFFAVFAAPRGAVDAAIAIQRGLQTVEHPGGIEVRVRVGVHSGYPTSKEDNYVGLDVNTTSRVCAVGHGGQIVVTENTRQAVRDTDAGGLRFVSLGTHRLRGLPDPVPLYQLGAAGLPTRFPALRGVAPA